MNRSSPFLLEYGNYGHGSIGALSLGDLRPGRNKKKSLEEELEEEAAEAKRDQLLSRKKAHCQKVGHQFDLTLFDGRKVCVHCRLLRNYQFVPKSRVKA